MNVLLADDHPLFLDGLEDLLRSNGFEVAGTAHDGLEAVEKARALGPDAILMDIRMPRLDGLAAVRAIKAELPHVKIVMLTISEADDDLFEAIKSGASGYLLKSQSAEELLALVREVERGEAAFSPGLAARILQEFGRQASALEEKRRTAGISERERVRGNRVDGRLVEVEEHDRRGDEPAHERGADDVCCPRRNRVALGEAPCSRPSVSKPTRQAPSARVRSAGPGGGAKLKAWAATARCPCPRSNSRPGRRMVPGVSPTSQKPRSW